MSEECFRGAPLRNREKFMDTIGIQNAPWWLPNSTVVVREDYLAEDEGWINSQLFSFGMSGSGANTTPDMQMSGKDRNTLFVQRMTQPGSVVAVPRSNGRVKTVHLPDEASQLLHTDLLYIVQRIEAVNAPPMTPQQQADFLKSVNGQSGGNLPPMNLPPISISDANSTQS
jgi:hypothetical protein